MTQPAISDLNLYPPITAQAPSNQDAYFAGLMARSGARDAPQP